MENFNFKIFKISDNVHFVIIMDIKTGYFNMVNLVNDYQF